MFHASGKVTLRLILFILSICLKYSHALHPSVQNIISHVEKSSVFGKQNRAFAFQPLHLADLDYLELSDMVQTDLLSDMVFVMGINSASDVIAQISEKKLSPLEIVNIGKKEIIYNFPCNSHFSV